MHPLVETFTDDRQEVYWSEVEEATAPLPPLIGRLHTMEEGLGDQGGTELPIRYGHRKGEGFNISYSQKPLEAPRD